MKRSPPPARRQPLRRTSAPLRTTRTGLPPEEKARRARVKAAVFERDGYRCRLAGVAGAGRCFGELTFHHRRKASQGGRYTFENGAALCAHHNEQLEADADLAALGVRLGLVLLRA